MCISVSSVREEWGLISICDIVLNHTANETPWLTEHPEATYNLVNSPHLRPAFILDRVVKRLARDIGEGAWVDRGIPKVTFCICFVIILSQTHVSGGNLNK